MLEMWLFEERLGYPKVLEKLKGEFGLETSLTAVRRFYKRLDVERSAQSLMDAVEMSGLTVEALKSGELKPAMLLLANKCVFELLRHSPVPIREVTALLRAITSAEAHTMKRTVFEREEAERKEAERVRKARESWRMTPADLAEEREELRQERAARKKAKQEAAEKAAREKAGVVEKKFNVDGHLSPKGGEGEESAQREVKGASAAPVVLADPQPSDALASRGTSGERVGERGVPIVTPDAGEAWQPSVVEEGQCAKNCVTEEAENRVAPLNAA
jgi:hypothetical protein